MYIAGMPYQYPPLWKAIHKALCEASVAAIPQVGAARLIADPDSHEVRHGLAAGFIVALEPVGRRLMRHSWEDGRDGHQLATDLVLNVTGLHPDAPQHAPFQLMRELGAELKKMSDAAQAGQVRTAAGRFFADARDKLDVQGLLKAQGVEITVNRLARKLRLTDKEQRHCVDFLAGWATYPALASLVLGRPLDVQVGDLELWRILKHRRCSVDVLMRWDRHCTYIRAQLPAALRGEAVPVPDEAATPAKGPLSAKHPKHYTFTPEAIKDILDQLAALESPHHWDSLDDEMRWLERIGQSVRDADPGEADRVLPPPAEEGGTEEADPSPDDSEDPGVDFEDDDPDEPPHSPGNEDEEGAEGIEGLSGPSAEPADDPEPEPAEPDIAAQGSLTDPCLKHQPLPLGVAVYLDLLETRSSKDERSVQRNALQDLLVEQGVMRRLGVPDTGLGKLTHAYLAARMPHQAGKPMKPAQFRIARAQAMTDFLACRQARLGRRSA